MKLADAADRGDELLALEYLASEPYTSFVYEDAAHARSIARFLWAQGAAEFSPPFGVVAVDDAGTTLGMMAVLDRDELARARMAAAMALVRGKLVDPDGPVRERMFLAGDALLAVAADDLYLSRIAVAPTARGRGVAGWLMADYERAARARGKRRLVLEVSPTHVAAIRLYERCGFGELETGRAEDPETGRALVYRHMMKPLD